MYPFPPIEILVATCLAGASVLAVIARLRRAGPVATVRRWLPFVEGVAVLVPIGMVVVFVATRVSVAGLVLLALAIALGTSLSATWIRAAMAGLTIAFEGRISRDDIVSLTGFEGRVEQLGLRTVRIRATDGTLHDVPNEQLLGDRVAVRAPGETLACEIVIPIPLGADLDQTLAMARDAAILSPAASPQRRPEAFVEPDTEGQERLRLRVRGWPATPALQERWRSDVLARVHGGLARSGPRAVD